MNTQNTPVHIRLWHREFWQMSIANWLLSMSAYMLIPVMPLWLMQTIGCTTIETGVFMGVFGVGLYLFGGFCSYLVQHFRRNHVCMLAIVAMMLSLIMLYYVDHHRDFVASKELVFGQRLLLGAFFGLAQMVLSSTLIIDTSESFQRTEANYSAAWFSRFAVALGPIAGLILYRMLGFEITVLSSVGCCLIAVMLIYLVKFPFRAPEEVIKKLSLDRFFLPQGLWLYINMLMITTVVGMLMSTGLSEWFYAMMMGGFFLAILAQRFVFPEAELKSEIITGLILMGASLLAMMAQSGQTLSYIAPLFIGLGVGIIGSRFQLFFIKLSRHCQRGTSQSMFMLSWETGLALGLFVGYAFLNEQSALLYWIAFSLILLALVFYNFFIHRWFISHKNR